MAGNSSGSRRSSVSRPARTARTRSSPKMASAGDSRMRRCMPCGNRATAAAGTGCGAGVITTSRNASPAGCSRADRSRCTAAISRGLSDSSSVVPACVRTASPSLMSSASSRTDWPWAATHRRPTSPRRIFSRSRNCRASASIERMESKYFRRQSSARLQSSRLRVLRADSRFISAGIIHQPRPGDCGVRQ